MGDQILLNVSGDRESKEIFKIFEKNSMAEKIEKKPAKLKSSTVLDTKSSNSVESWKSCCEFGKEKKELECFSARHIYLDIVCTYR